MRAGHIAAFIAAVFAMGSGSAACAQETPHLQFVTEYVRELSETERLRQRAQDDLKGSKNPLADCIRNTTSLKLELQSQVAIMKGMTLKAPFAGLPDQIADFYQQKINLYDRFANACSTMIAGPQPGVDYGKIAGEMPQITAKLDYVDHALFEAAPLIFATLIDEKPDPQGHVSHLVITNAERTQLLSEIQTEFGEKLDAQDTGYLVGSAAVVKSYLLKDFKGSDDPW